MPTRENSPSLPRSGGGDATVFVSGKTWDMLMDRLEALEGVFHPDDFDVRQGKDGKQVRLKNKIPEAVASERFGSFCKMYKDDDGDTYLQGGTIVGGNTGSVVIADEKVLDSTTAAGSNAGKSLYLKANITAFVEADITQFGVKLNSASLTTTLPTAHDFTDSSPTGIIFREVGRWTDTTFLPSGACGLSRAGGCIRDYKLE